MYFNFAQVHIWYTWFLYFYFCYFYIQIHLSFINFRKGKYAIVHIALDGLEFLIHMLSIILHSLGWIGKFCPYLKLLSLKCYENIKDMWLRKSLATVAGCACAVHKLVQVYILVLLFSAGDCAFCRSKFLSYRMQG